ncbi:MAG: hypothetical protein IJP48_08290, partial [Synergistaceae bacterium]|nr:hypothetical protein [Synergistaceae bacterium]
MSIAAVLSLVGSASSFIITPSVGTGFALLRSSVVMLQDSFNEDVANENLKKNIADSDLRSAKSVLASLSFEEKLPHSRDFSRELGSYKFYFLYFYLYFLFPFLIHMLQYLRGERM